MRRYLIVGNETLLGEPLVQEVRRRIETDGDVALHIVVPATHVEWIWTEGQARWQAERQLELAEERFRALGAAEVTGQVGEASPVQAVSDALLSVSHAFDEVIISTFPLGISRWLRADAVHRLQRTFPKLPVTHVTMEPAEVPTP